MYFVFRRYRKNPIKLNNGGTMRVFLMVLTTLMLYQMTGCTRPHSGKNSNTVKIAVSILPQQYFVRKIGGNLVDIITLVPPGASPHSYEPKPSQMVELSQCSLYFTIGIDFEAAWQDRLRSASKQLKIIPTDTGIEKIASSGEHHEHGEQHERKHMQGDHERFDPHIWLSPELVKHQAGIICDALVAADSLHKETYRMNLANFIQGIETLQKEIWQIRNGCPEDHGFMIFHPAWAYFAREFNLTEYPLEIDGKEPSPRELVNLVTFAKEKNITTIFIQPQFSPQTALQIAKEIGASTVEVNDLAEDWAENLLKVATVTSSCSHDK
jgi:zinc transport system substrate-binding protein